MLIDLHCHTKYSRDNDLDPEELIARALELGLDGVCITEHYSVDASRPVTRVTAPNGFLVLRGVEISTDAGHLLAYGLADDSWNIWGRNTYLNVEEVIRRVKALGGICVPAHPFRGWESLDERIFSLSGIDALETHNGGNLSEHNQPAIKAAMKLGLPSVGGSDCHTVDRVGRAVTEFFRPVKSIEDVVREIRAGNCRGIYRNRQAERVP